MTSRLNDAFKWFLAGIACILLAAPAVAANSSEQECPKGSWKNIDPGHPKQTGCFTCYDGLSRQKTGVGTGVFGCDATIYSKGVRVANAVGPVCSKGWVNLKDMRCYTCPSRPKVVWKDGQKDGIKLYGAGADGWKHDHLRPANDERVCSLYVNGHPIPVVSESAVKAQCEKIVEQHFSKPGNEFQQLLFPPALVEDLKNRTTELRKQIEPARNDYTLQRKDSVNRLAEVVARGVFVREMNRMMGAAEKQKREIEHLFSPKVLCDGVTLRKTLGSIGLVPDPSAFKVGGRAFMAYSLSLSGTFAGTSMTVSQSVVTNYTEDGTAIMLSIGPGLSTEGVGGGTSFSIQYYPDGGTLSNFEGFGMEFGISAGLPMDLTSAGTSSLMTLKAEPKGIGASIGVGAAVNPFPVNGSFSVNYARILLPIDQRQVRTNVQAFTAANKK